MSEMPDPAPTRDERIREAAANLAREFRYWLDCYCMHPAGKIGNAALDELEAALGMKEE